MTAPNSIATLRLKGNQITIAAGDGMGVLIITQLNGGGVGKPVESRTVSSDATGVGVGTYSMH